jgi:replicative DNA helicase
MVGGAVSGMISDIEQDKKQQLESQRRDEVREYEECFLGSLLMLHTSEIPQLKIKAHCFSNPNNGRIFKTFFSQLRNGTSPDYRTLGLDPDLRDIGAIYINSLTDKIPSAANIGFKDYQSRTAKFAAEEFKARIEAAEYHGDIEPAIREYMGILSGALSDKHRDVFISFDEYINTQARKEYWREYTPHLFGTLPFPDGTISAIGAAPGGGKSAALVNLCRELLTTQPANNPHPKDSEKAQDINADIKILFISAEMAAADIIDRLIHSLAWQKAGVGQPYYLERVKQTNKDYWKVLKYKYGTPPDYWEYTHEELQRAELYKSVIEKQIQPALNGRLKIAYVRGLKCFDDIYNIILNNAEPGTLVLMDYLQLMPICSADIGQGNPRYLEIRHIMDMGIIAAEKTQSVIIAAAQLGREERANSNSKDETQGWRESGDIEQTAWNLIKMNRDKEKMSFKITKARSSEGVNTAHDLEWIPCYQYMTYKGKYTAPEKSNNNTQIGSFRR